MQIKVGRDKNSGNYSFVKLQRALLQEAANPGPKILCLCTVYTGLSSVCFLKKNTSNFAMSVPPGPPDSQDAS